MTKFYLNNSTSTHEKSHTMSNYEVSCHLLPLLAFLNKEIPDDTKESNINVHPINIYSNLCKRCRQHEEEKCVAVIVLNSLLTTQATIKKSKCRGKK